MNERQLGPWRRQSRELRYDNRWLSLYHDEVLTPGGSKGIYGVVHFKSIAIGIIPLDGCGNTWLVSQYRYTLEQRHFEIPMGGCPLHDEPLEGARRELQEECGITADCWTELMTLHTTNSVSDESGRVFLAEGLSFGESSLEDSEADLCVHKMPFKEVYEWVLAGKITDAISVAGVLRTAVLRPELVD
ncbi:8-oxo-dGTP pyrophosphatase MutT (NUDIX family) [Sinobacterium caligoides]|uniref:8-oxo-dGTP pyrophosphatase MutT (NUDIX family) n=1 Tax=Sinobacterium caligoides TaxID=933926 RepID=A0A3N2DNI8_9GAMM|nr:NUDIX hydrolase [Sinobacterium caligoides]ROS01252.1 8-oxo-dGTP pyrophosphatase MutT (NUDIX family) [Sinobacterium caligoides]